MRMNKKKFMQTAMGMEIESTVRTWDSALEEKKKAELRNGHPDQGLGYTYWNNTCISCQAKWEAFKVAIYQFYGILFYFTRTDEYFGICNEDESIWLLKIRRERKNDE